MQKEKFLRFLEYEKRYSVHTLKSYSTDLEQFIQFLSSEFQVNTVENINFQFVRSWIARLLSNNISTFLGKISYSLYLFHQPFYAGSIRDKC